MADLPALLRRAAERIRDDVCDEGGLDLPEDRRRPFAERLAGLLSDAANREATYLTLPGADPESYPGTEVHAMAILARSYLGETDDDA